MIKDVLALTNGNVGVAHQPAYLIIGADDTLQAEAMRVIGADDIVQGAVPRKLYDVGTAPITRSRLLSKVNDACTPPLPDLACDLVEVSGQRLFVITIPPSPHLHQTTRRLDTSTQGGYPENTIFIRRGEDTRTATMDEVEAIRQDKRRSMLAHQPATPSLALMPATTQDIAPVPPAQHTSAPPTKQRQSWNAIVPRLTFWVVVGFVTLWSIAEGRAGHIIADGIVGAALGAIIGVVFYGPVRLVYWLIRRQPSQGRAWTICLWVPIGCGVMLGIVTANTLAEGFVGVVTGALLGLVVGSLLVLALSTTDWLGRNRGDRR